jgi:putative addiction module component (TIGR02574 family)
MSREELYAHVLRLSREERAQLAEELLFSLEESDEQIAAAWASELERRSGDIAEGKVRTVEFSVAHAEILAELENRRAGRATS